MSNPPYPPYPPQDRNSPADRQRSNPYGYTRAGPPPPRGPNPASQRGYDAPPPRQQPMRNPPPYGRGGMNMNGPGRPHSPGQRGPRPQQPPPPNMEMGQMNRSRPPPPAPPAMPNNGSNPYSSAGGNPYSNQNGNPYGNQASNPYGSPASNSNGNPYGSPASNPNSNTYGGPACNPNSNTYGGPANNPNSNPYNGSTSNPNTNPDSLPLAPTPASASRNNQPPRTITSTTTNTTATTTPANANTTTSILDQCASIKAETSNLNNQLNQLQNLQSRSISSPDPRGPTSELDSLTTTITATYKTQLARLTALKRDPMAVSNAAASSHIASTESALRQTWTRYQTLEASFRKRNVEAAERQYRIVRPDAPESEVKQACADVDNAGGSQVFAQALMQGQRRDQAQTALGAVRQRHEAIAKIERDMIELAGLFEQLAETVAVQEVSVQKIEDFSADTHQNTVAAVKELGSAEESARKARKKKWICFWIGIVVLIIAIIAVVIALHQIGLF